MYLKTKINYDDSKCYHITGDDITKPAGIFLNQIFFFQLMFEPVPADVTATHIFNNLKGIYKTFVNYQVVMDIFET